MSTTQDVAYHMGGVPVHGEFTTGSVFFVDSVNGSDGNTGKKPSSAFATADKATNACTANKHNIVYFMPNHAETLSAATTWVPDVEGVQYIGVGMGADAPEFTFSATTSIMTIAGNCTFRNLRFVAGVSAVVTACDVDGNHVTFDNCTWDFSTTLFDFVTMIDVDAYDYLTVQNCRFIAENATAGAAQAIGIDDAHHVVIRNNIFTGDFSISVIANPSADAEGNGLMILDNYIYNDDTAATGGGILLENACTGLIANNTIAHLNPDEGDGIIDPGSCIMAHNYVAEAIDKYGIDTLIGTAGS